MMSKGSGPLDVLPCMACQQVKFHLHLLYGHLIYLFTEIVFFFAFAFAFAGSVFSLLVYLLLLFFIRVWNLSF